ncbi:phosphatidate cytidylyltransferase [Comamonas sp.]|uniref:phosphatidate cytidylyltransferase n=1 Tax=Comamonas sp. TaxID=34028 RepID=UPI0028969FDB|nr:phosphatidate cytidylyltransferase [Comamonas sp.]
MLLQRVITAMVLLAILLPALFASNPLPFNIIVLVMLTAGAWEWARLIGLRAVGAVITGAVMLLLCLLTWQLDWLSHAHRVLWVIAGGVWVLGSALLIKAGVPAWGRVPQWVRWLAGVLALWVAGLAIVQARQMGINFLLSILALVWVADIFAYFSGRAFGLRFTKQKLAPAISPGKSWEGAWGGAAGVVLMAFVWVWMDAAQKAEVASFYTRLYEQGWWLLLVAALFMAAMSVVGDLVESLIKRSAGFKDSSQLLPGHGGVLDRIDALLPTLPLAMMLISLVQ